jgi:hypothetical protein
MRASLWTHPEWWSLCLSASAWIALLWSAHPAHTVPFLLAPYPLSALLPALIAWLLMVLAMMVPLVIFPLRLTATRSLWSRRDRAVAAFLAGFAGRWLVPGVFFSGVEAGLSMALPSPREPWLPAIAFGLAAAWELTPAPRRAAAASPVFLRCDGWGADCTACYGWRIGGQCVTAAVGHHARVVQRTTAR